MTEQVEQWICIKFCVKLEHSSVETIWMIQKAAAMGNWWLAASSWQHTCSHIMSCAEFCGETSTHQVTQPQYSTDLVPTDFWLFPRLKSPLKGKRFQAVDEVQENAVGQLMATGRTLWGPKVPTLKGTEASLSYVQCFLYLVSSSINVCIFHITWICSSFFLSFCMYLFLYLLDRPCMFMWTGRYISECS